MPRGPRLDSPDTLHHVIAHGIERCTIFRDDVDRLAALANARHLCVYAWSLLDNHFLCATAHKK